MGPCIPREGAIEFQDMAYGLSTSYRLLVRNALVDFRLVPSSHANIPFIVLCTPRTGSNLLGSLLSRHPQVLMCGELFDARKVFAAPYPVFPWTRAMRRIFPVWFLRRKIFRRLPEGLVAAGFKIMYHQCAKPGSARVWDFLEARRDLRVIHLKRQNILRSLVSLRKAQLTGRWVQFRPDDRDDTSITLDPEECEQEFEKVRSAEGAFDDRFHRHAMLQVTYEDLASDHRGQMARVGDFLQLAPHHGPPSIHKQGHMPLSTAITNYVALREHFRGSRWEQFFDE